MSLYLAPTIIFLAAMGGSLGVFFLVRLTCRAFKEKRIAKGIGFSLATLLVLIIALFYIISWISMLIIALVG